MGTLIVAWGAIAAGGGVLFEDRSDQIPIEGFSVAFGGDPRVGCALFDPDTDGDLDLYLANGPTQPNLLYRNNADGTFTEVGGPAGAAVGTGSSGVLAADLDGDGATDLLLAGTGGMTGRGESPLVLLVGAGDGSFTDVTAASGITGAVVNLGASAADIDGDGDLDVFVLAPGSFPLDEQHRNTLYRNEGDGTFTEIGALAGVDTDFGACASTFTHVDGDDAIDLIVANCNDVDFATTPIEVFINDGTGRFIDRAPQARVWGLGYWMGLALGDFDHNGALDFFATNLGAPEGFPHALYLNDGDGTYVDGAAGAGVADFEYGWGAVAADFDNDADLDLYYVGTSRRGASPAGFAMVSPGHLFDNLGDGTFAPPVQPVDLTPYNHSGLCQGDIFADGFVDLLVMVTADPRADSVGLPVLLENQGNDHHWLTVRPRGHAPNTGAVGARIYATTPQRRQLREIAAGTSFVSTHSPWPTFGLATEPSADLCVRWPDGTGEAFGSFEADRVVDLVQGQGIGPDRCEGSAQPDPPTVEGAGTAPGPCGCRTPGGSGWWIGLWVVFSVRRGRAAR